MLSVIGVLSASTARMSPQWIRILAERSVLLHPAFVTDCFALFALLHNSLRTGIAMPVTMPIFERLGYHRERAPRSPLGPLLQPPSGPTATRNIDLTSSNNIGGAEPIDGQNVAVNDIGGTMTWDLCRVS